MATTEWETLRRRGGAMVRVLAAGAVLGVAGVGGWAGLRALRPSSSSGLTADLALAARTSFDITTTATGELQAKNQIELRSELETESTIAELAPEGVMVRKGDLLVRLNSEQIQTSLDEAQLRVESAKADLVAAEKGYEIQQSENESKIRQAKLKLELAELALKQWEEGEKVQKLKDIELALDKTEKELKRLKERFERSEDLYAKGFLSKNERDLDEIALREAEAARAKALLEENTYKNYQLYKDQKQKTSDVEEAREELKRVQEQAEIQLAIKDAERVNKKRQLQLHQDKLTKLQKQMAATTVRAPQDGLVVYATSAGRNWFDDTPFTVGRVVRPQEPLIVLPDTSVMIAAVRVHESLAGRIKPGQRATVKIDAVAGRVFTGTVDSIGVMAEMQMRWMDPNRREYTVKIALDPTDEEIKLRPSMRCEAMITLGRVDDVVAVPLQAVFSEEAVQFVYVPRGSKYTRVPVKMGRRSETMAEIVSGVGDGERVLVREPSAGEILRAPWDAAALKLAGFEIGPDGKPAPIEVPQTPKAAVAAGTPEAEAPPAVAAKPEPTPGAPKADEPKPEVKPEVTVENSEEHAAAAAPPPTAAR